MNVNKYVSKCLRGIDRVLNYRYADVLDPLISFLKGKNQVIITYVGSYSSPAKYALLVLRSITKYNAYFFKPNELTYYVAPYDEGRELSVLVFAYPDGLSDLNILLDQIRYTGHDYLIIVPEDLPKILSYKIPKDKLINLKLGNDLIRYWVLATHLLIGNVIPKLCSKGIRSDRLLNEATNISPDVMHDLINHYEKEITDISRTLLHPVIITATPTMWGVAEYLALSNEIRSLRILSTLDQVSKYVTHVNNVLLIDTDVEEYSLKSIKGLTLTAATNIKELKLHTDPLTAPFYGLILARVIECITSSR